MFNYTFKYYKSSDYVYTISNFIINYKDAELI